MSSRLSVIFYIILCLEIGLVLTVLPWVPHGWLGLSDWSNNYFLLLAAHKTGYGVQRFVASGWVRGAVSGIGILNLGMGVWEFRDTKRPRVLIERGACLEGIFSAPWRRLRCVGIEQRGLTPK